MDTKPWWTSRGIWSAVVTGVVMLLGIVHVNVSATDQATLINDLVMGAGLIGSLVGLYYRITATKRLTLHAQPLPAGKS